VDVNIEIRVSASLLTSKVALVSTEKQAYCDQKLDWTLWRTGTAVSVVNVAQVILPAFRLFIHLVFGNLPVYVEMYK